MGVSAGIFATGPGVVANSLFAPSIVLEENILDMHLLYMKTDFI